MSEPVVRPAAPADYDAVRRLMHAFIDWHYDRHGSERHIIDSYFDPAEFAEELASLPGAYGPPRGRLLVADVGGSVAGCVALRELSAGACEMKRMFVDPQYHGSGLGMLLGTAIIDAARSIGYDQMFLDTGPEQREAQGLYRKLGFADAEPYYDLPPHLREWLVFMKLDLHGSPAAKGWRGSAA